MMSDFLVRRLRPCWLVFAAGLLLANSATAAPRAPNFILILMDDMGWRDVGFMGNTFVETPHLDRLAKSGLVFGQAYASAPNCAPTRACLMSGQYTPRHGVYTVVDPNHAVGSPRHKLLAAESKAELGTNFVTIAEALRDGGYATAFFGMWNLGRGRTGPVTPGGQGFQKVVFPENLGFGKDAYFDERGNYLSDRLTDEVLKFVEAHREQPFFVYYPDHAVHAPFEPKPDLLKKYEQKAARTAARDNPAYAATIEAVDQNVGRILQALERGQLSDRTYVIFTSDNGGADRDTRPLRGGKGQLYEGGVRVPLAIAGPNLAKPGTTCDPPVSSVDLYPTLLELAQLPTPADTRLDGVSLAPLLRGASTLTRTRLFWHFPCYVGKGTPSSAVRDGDFKLIEFFEDGGRRELYNLRTDPGEERNLAATMPEQAAALDRVLQAWQTETGAAIPRDRNPNYDPKAKGPGGQGNKAGSKQGTKGRKGQQPDAAK